MSTIIRCEATTIVREFEGQGVDFQIVEGVYKVSIEQVAIFCGWSYEKSGKSYIRWNTVNGFLGELGLSQQVAKGDFIPEYLMYPLIGKAKTEKATKFMIWVGQVIAQLRQTGVVIMDHATDDSIDFSKRYGTYRIRKTFINTQNIFDEYESFKAAVKIEQRAKRLTCADKIKLAKLAAKGIEERKALSKRDGDRMNCLDLLCEVQEDITKWSNYTSGAIKKKKNMEIRQLEENIDTLDKDWNEFMDKYESTVNCHIEKQNRKIEEISKYNPCQSEYIKIPVHPLSKHKKYDMKSHRGIPVQVCTKEYRQFKNDISKYAQFIADNFSHIDFSKKVVINCKYVVQNSGYDAINFLDCLSDALVEALAPLTNLRDDNKFESGIQKIRSYNKNPNSCCIYLCIKQL